MTAHKNTHTHTNFPQKYAKIFICIICLELYERCKLHLNMQTHRKQIISQFNRMETLQWS